MKATHAMENNFESTCGQKQDTIRKVAYAKKAALQASTTPHENKQERKQMRRDLQKRLHMLTKTTPASRDSA